jgi:hypothetical protein
MADPIEPTVNPAASALLFSTSTAAVNRSQQMAGAMGCDGVHTKYWYPMYPLSNGQWAMIVQPSGPFGSKPGPAALSQLTPAEIAALQPSSAWLSLISGDPI